MTSKPNTSSDSAPIVTSEINQKFRDRKDQALTVSYYKYGAIKDAYPHKVSAIKTLEKRLRLYKKTGNADYLVDISNFAEIEFTFPAHPEFHDSPKDGGEGRYWQGGGTTSERPNK